MLKRIGIVLPTRGLLITGQALELRVLVSLARRAEQLGIDSVWVGDSLTAKPRLEPLTTLAAIAGSTERIGLGTAALLAPLRQPVALAQTTATLQLLSGGRLTLGMGVGGTFNAAQQQEWLAAGVDPARRGGRMTELVELMRLLWSGEQVSFEGRHFRFDGVSIGYAAGRAPEFGPPRVLLACHSGERRGAQYERASRFGDGMLSITDSPEELADVRDKVLERVSAAGRDADAFETAYYMTVNLSGESAGPEADAFIRGYYGVNFWGERWGPFGEPARVAERALAYVDAGADEMIFRFAASDQRAQLELFGEHVLPALRRDRHGRALNKTGARTGPAG